MEINFQKLMDKERIAQIKKWGIQEHTEAEWITILVEEVGELAQAILQKKYTIDELVQVATVCQAMYEDYYMKEGYKNGLYNKI